MRIAINSKSPQGKEECIETVEKLGKWIEKNAETIVGDLHGVTGIYLNFSLNVGEIPTLEISKDMYINVDEV